MKTATAIIAALLLFSGAAFHLSALPMLVQGIEMIESEFLRSAFLPLWIIPSQHWIIYGALILVCYKNTHPFAKRVLWLIAFSLFIDATLIYYKLGIFVGNIILFIAALLTLSSTLISHKPSFSDVEK